MISKKLIINSKGYANIDCFLGFLSLKGYIVDIMTFGKPCLQCLRTNIYYGLSEQAEKDIIQGKQGITLYQVR
jgi:hypothetical protein